MPPRGILHNPPSKGELCIQKLQQLLVRDKISLFCNDLIGTGQTIQSQPGRIPVRPDERHWFMADFCTVIDIERLFHGNHIDRLAGKEFPLRSGVESFRVVQQPIRCIMLRIDGDGYHRKLSCLVAKYRLHLSETG